MENLGARIRAARLARGLTIMAFATALRAWPSQVSRWENGKHRPSRRVLEEIEAVLGVSLPPDPKGPQAAREAPG